MDSLTALLVIIILSSFFMNIQGNRNKCKVAMDMCMSVNQGTEIHCHNTQDSK